MAVFYIHTLDKNYFITENTCFLKIVTDDDNSILTGFILFSAALLSEVTQRLFYCPTVRTNVRTSVHPQSTRFCIKTFVCISLCILTFYITGLHRIYIYEKKKHFY